MTRGIGLTGAAVGLLLSVVVIGLGGCRPGPQIEPRLPDVRLVVLIVADQLSASAFERFRPAFEGGLARLEAEGVRFTEAHHEHAPAETAPGHASLATGTHPRTSGIVGNRLFDPDREEWFYSVEDERHGSSPRRLLVPALGDWIRGAAPEARVYAVAGKDRSAIFLGGHGAEGAYWYDRESGEFTSSDYYPQDSPEWLRERRSALPADEYFGRLWEPLTGFEGRFGEVGIVELDEGVFPREFPHPIGEPTVEPEESFYGLLYGTPFLDEMILDLAKRIVVSRDLGREGQMDFLGISFSALDLVGHAYGPHSPEFLDTIRRLDRSLGRLMSFLEEEVGAEHLLLALSSDHGVMPLPEVLRSQGVPASREGPEEVVCVQSTARQWSRRTGEGFGDAAGFQADLENCPHLRKVWTTEELHPYDPVRAARDRDYRRFANSFHPERSPDLILQWEEHHLLRRGRGTSHYGPYEEDNHVPLILWSPALRSATVSERVATVDLAPTLAGLLGIPIPETVDGADRSGGLKLADRTGKGSGR